MPNFGTVKSRLVRDTGHGFERIRKMCFVLTEATSLLSGKFIFFNFFKLFQKLVFIIFIIVRFQSQNCDKMKILFLVCCHALLS